MSFLDGEFGRKWFFFFKWKFAFFSWYFRVFSNFNENRLMMRFMTHCALFDCKLLHNLQENRDEGARESERERERDTETYIKLKSYI